MNQTMNLLGAAVALALLNSCAPDGALQTVSQGVTDERPRALSRVASGLDHTCAVLSKGAVYCWGDNSRGQLGVDPARVGYSEHPVEVQGLNGVIQVTAGDRHTCALRVDGELWCWGDNGRGQLGINDPSIAFDAQPRRVDGFGAGDPRLVQVEAGDEHTCAIRTEQSHIGSGNVLYCWGRGTEGQLGDGSASDQHAPVQIFANGTHFVIDIAPGSEHTCALAAGGFVRCWGANREGELGNGTTTPERDAWAATVVAGRYTDISAGREFTCGVSDTGGVLCWGRGAEHQLGTGVARSELVPTRADIDGVRTISAGRAHACVTRAIGDVRCWGDNSRGQLGAGHTSVIAGPVAVASIGKLRNVEVASGGAHTCAATIAGSLYCWGDNAAGQLGDGTLTSAPSPVQSQLTSLNRQATLTAGYRHACAITHTGETRCWGSNSFAQTAAPSTFGTWVTQATTASVLGTLRDVDGGRYHSCGIDGYGRAVCWGSNEFGQLGNNASGSSASTAATRVANLGNVVSIAAGNSFSCAVDVEGSVFCWGDNRSGQVAGSASTLVTLPARVSVATPARKVVARGNAACALLVDSRVQCWGQGYMGNGLTGSASITASPVFVEWDPSSSAGRGHLSVAIDLVRGADFGCALLGDSSVWCWGYNSDGQLGLGSTVASPYARELGISAISDVRSLAAGVNHACALRSNGEAWCWGDNSYGQLGVGAGPDQLAPVRANAAYSNALRQIVAGEGFTCGAHVDGNIDCWGANQHYQCGSASGSMLYTPTPVTNFP